MNAKDKLKSNFEKSNKLDMNNNNNKLNINILY